MKKVVKKIIGVMLALCLFVEAGLQSNAESRWSNYNYKANLKGYSLEQLYLLSHQVVNAVFEEIISRLEVSSKYSTQATGASTPAIDSYISLIKASVSTSHVLTIEINVKSNIPSISYFDFTIGYEYPGACRTDGTKVSLEGMSKGKHTITINTKGLVSGINVVAEIKARDYKERKVFKSLFDKPFACKTVFHEINSNDVMMDRVQSKIPDFILLLTCFGKIGKAARVAITILEGLNFVSSYLSSGPEVALAPKFAFLRYNSII